MIVGYFASWNSYFLLISATVNTLAMSRNAAQGTKPGRILSKQLLTGACLVVIGAFVNGFLYDGYLGTAIRTGDWLDLRPMTHGVSAMYTLQMIGWSMILGASVHYLLMWRGGHRRARRNILVYLLLALVVIVLSPAVHSWVDGMPWEVPTTPAAEYVLGDHSDWPSVHVQAANASVRAWFFALLAGDLEPLFPYLATWFVGAAAGGRCHDELPPLGKLRIGSRAGSPGRAPGQPVAEGARRSSAVTWRCVPRRPHLAKQVGEGTGPTEPERKGRRHRGQGHAQPMARGLRTSAVASPRGICPISEVVLVRSL